MLCHGYIVKAIVQPKMTFLSLYSHPHVAPVLYILKHTFFSIRWKSMGSKQLSITEILSLSHTQKRLNFNFCLRYSMKFGSVPHTIHQRTEINFVCGSIVYFETQTIYVNVCPKVLYVYSAKHSMEKSYIYFALISWFTWWQHSVCTMFHSQERSRGDWTTIKPLDQWTITLKI